MNHRSFIAHATALLIALVSMPALACDFSFSLGNASPTETAAPTARAQAPTATLRALPPTTPATALSSPTAASPSSPAVGGGIITNVVLATETTPLTGSPLGITDTFPPTGEVHVNTAIANAPSGTKIKAIWTVVDAGSAAPKNTEITNYATTAEGTRFVDIVFTPSQKMPAGSYKIDVLLNEKLERTLNFTVKEGIAPFVVPTPKAVGSCPPPPRPDYRPPLVAKKLTMAESVTSNGDPVNATRQFKPNSTFHAIAALENAPSNSKIKAVWYALDTGGAEACNTRLVETEVTTSGTRNVWFKYTPPEKYPLGVYKVDIFVNGNLNIDVDFTVK